MAISALQQSAFNLSVNFMDQVNSVVKQQALIKAEADPSNQSILASVVRNPSQFGFPPALVADAGWAVTYDAWANDPKTADQPILGLVQKWFNLLTGYVPPPPPEGATLSVSEPEDTAEEA